MIKMAMTLVNEKIYKYFDLKNGVVIFFEVIHDVSLGIKCF